MLIGKINQILSSYVQFVANPCFGLCVYQRSAGVSKCVYLASYPGLFPVFQCCLLKTGTLGNIEKLGKGLGTRLVYTIIYLKYNNFRISFGYGRLVSSWLRRQYCVWLLATPLVLCMYSRVLNIYYIAIIYQYYFIIFWSILSV